MRFFLCTLVWMMGVLPRAWANDYLQLNMSVSVRDATGAEILLPADTAARSLVGLKNLEKDTLKISVVSSPQKKLNWKSYSVDRRAFFQSVAVPLPEAEKKARDYRGRRLELEPGIHIVGLARSSSFPGYLYGIAVDAEGKPRDGDLKKSVVYIPELSFIAAKILHGVVLPKDREEMVAWLKEADCADLPAEAQAQDFEQLGDIVYAATAAERSPFSMLVKYRRALKVMSGSFEQCLRNQRTLELKILQKSSWGKLSLEERARKIYELTQNVFAEVALKGAELAGKQGVEPELDPHLLDPLLSPELAACISYTESEQDLNPYGTNYQFCNEPPYYSTANGLNHVVESTVRIFKGFPTGNLMPLVTEASKKLEGFDPKDLHRAASAIPEAQSEMLYRVLNYELKRARAKLGRRAKSQRILTEAVAQYDRDHQSAYLKKVVNACYPCMMKMRKSGGDAYRCYEKVANQ